MGSPREREARSYSTLFTLTSGLQMDLDVLTLGFARRATEYKRATMIFSDLEKLKEVTIQDKIQLIFAGKAHPKDEMGKNLIKDIYDLMDRLKGEIEIVYLENYNMDMAGKLLRALMFG